MKSVLASILVVGGVAGAMAAAPQNPPAAAAQNPPAMALGTDVYHVMFTKAAPGQAAELAKVLMTPDTSSPMPDHFIVLRHQEGDDWDYVVIQHLGAKAEVVGTPSATNPARALTAWHNDTFASGPAWGEFTKQMAIGGAAAAGGSPVYVLGVHRAVAGHRDQLQSALSAATAGAGKIETGNVLMQHVEGGDWNLLTLTRYNSWQDLGNDRGAAASATTPGGWADIRQHSAFHRDTIADRIFPAK
jgi:hypothetical protein